jgi:hypothetical protein
MGNHYLSDILEAKPNIMKLLLKSSKGLRAVPASVNQKCSLISLNKVNINMPSGSHWRWESKLINT